MNQDIAGELEKLTNALLRADMEIVVSAISKMMAGYQLTSQDLGSLYNELPPGVQYELSNLTLYSPEEFKAIAGRIFEHSLDKIFIMTHQYARTKSGDITPEQTFLLSALSEDLLDKMFENGSGVPVYRINYESDKDFQKLVRLIVDQTVQNLPEQQMDQKFTAQQKIEKLPAPQKRRRITDFFDKWLRPGRTRHR